MQVLQFCLVRLSVGRSHRGMSGPSVGIVAGLAVGLSAVMGEPPAGDRTHPAGWDTVVSDAPERPGWGQAGGADGWEEPGEGADEQGGG